MSNVVVAAVMTAIAGLATGIGGLAVFFSKKANKKFLAFTLGISAGVMIYVSFVELFAKAQEVLSESFGERGGAIWTVVAFFAGIVIIAVIDKIIPEPKDASESRMIEIKQEKVRDSHLMRTGIVTALALGIHNFPEGMATFMSAVSSPALALPVVFAIAIHNIPEGIAVAVPVYFATGNRKKAFLLSLASGFAEPVGAIIGYIALAPFIGETVNAVVFAGIAGIMVFISVNELLPSAEGYGEHNLSICGLICGMAIMAVSLIVFI